LRRDVATIAERLSAGGYRTLFSGKWHLGVFAFDDCGGGSTFAA
jgi:arylsulfatase A-like enzyme